MCVECMIHTFTVRYREIIYSVQCGLRIRTGVHNNAMKHTCKFNKIKKFKISTLGFIEMGYKYLAFFSIILSDFFDIIWQMYCFKGGSY